MIQERIGRVDGLGIDGDDHRFAFLVREGFNQDVDASVAAHSDSNPRCSPAPDLGLELLDEELAFYRHSEVAGRGLEPIEMEVQKELGLTGPADIRRYGVDKFNEACRRRVMANTEVWEAITRRIGLWVDFENDYNTRANSLYRVELEGRAGTLAEKLSGGEMQRVAGPLRAPGSIPGWRTLARTTVVVETTTGSPV